MIDFDTILARLRLLYTSKNKKKKAYDKDVALMLGLSPEYFAVIKKRGKIPYRELILFCHETKISINWLFFGDEGKETSAL